MYELQAESVCNSNLVGNTVVLGHDGKHEVVVHAPVAKVLTVGPILYKRLFQALHLLSLFKIQTNENYVF